MKIKELIEKLSLFNEELEVFSDDGNGGVFCLDELDNHIYFFWSSSDSNEEGVYCGESKEDLIEDFELRADPDFDEDDIQEGILL